MGPRIGRRLAVVAVLPALLLAGSSLLLASPALADLPPTLTSVSVDSQNHVTAAWTLPAGATETVGELAWNHTGTTWGLEVNSNGDQINGEVAWASLGPGEASWTSGEAFQPGTYYFQVWAESSITDPDCANPLGSESGVWPCGHYSNVRQVVVPQLAPPPPPPSPPPAPPAQPVQCIVPRFVFNRTPLATIEHELYAAHCLIGRILRTHNPHQIFGRGGHVEALNPRPGRRLPKGTRVNITILGLF